MSESYFELSHCTELSDATQLQLARSIDLHEAINQHRDFAFLGAAILKPTSELFGEILYVDVECDEVPPNNPLGILFREKFAIYIPHEQQELIEVYALRKSFPLTAHQNQHISGFPTSLCLYFEPPASVARTWTAQKFLRRIQWWLEKTSVNQLHPSDQPVENLFFVTPYELVLPWNFEALRNNPGAGFHIIRTEPRFDKGITFFIEKAPENHPNKLINYVDVELPPVIHGVVERIPETLGELAELLNKRGVDFIQHLKTKISSHVPTMGLEVGSDNDATIIVLHIPLCRTQGAAPDKIQCKAFLVNLGALKLGAILNFLFLLEKKYFNFAELPTERVNTDWKDIKVFSMDVRYRNDIPAFRAQSGTLDSDPDAVLIGAGALGSAMLDLWARSGWGKWAVVDKDHIKPHNLSRHIAYTQHIGHSKADIVAQLYRCVVDGARDIVAINTDATHLSSAEMQEALASKSLVIDASTTLEYPRSASQNDELPRHISVFITPSGKSAVVLAEDEQRTIRLRTLEAQYYRALIQLPWGNDHLDGNISTFWSGASCRDISFVISHIQVTAHAATLAGQCQQLATNNVAHIGVWNRDPVTGTVAVQTVAANSERKIEAGEFTIYIDDGARDQLFALRQASIPNETGGVLLGYYDFLINALIIVCGLEAPADSVSTESSFARGTDGLADAVNEANRRTAGVVSYIGEWHSHPPGCSVMPSADDLGQMAYLSKNMADDGLPAVQIIVGDGELSIIFASLKYSC